MFLTVEEWFYAKYVSKSRVARFTLKEPPTSRPIIGRVRVRRRKRMMSVS